jgi:formylglycine-generating enzyme required for sulfatase activity
MKKQSKNRSKPASGAKDSRPSRGRARLLLTVLGALLITGLVGYFAWVRGSGSARSAVAPEPVNKPAPVFIATNPNPDRPPGSAPPGMVWIPGGEFSMGAQDPGEMDDVGMKATYDSRPVHRVYVDGFFMDKTDVTNSEFAKFAKATGYVTVAERKPRPEDYPGALPENLVAGSVVFAPPDHPVPLDDHFQWWTYARGASWRHPQGAASNLTTKDNYPVVHIAYEDAVAYAKWAGKRLPTEAEFEFAARGGLSGKLYVWGDEFRPQGRWMANTHQGHFPDHDSGEDGFTGAAPVATFPPNGYGLYDMAGNVWQWTSDWYRPDYYSQLAAQGIARNPQGPDSSLDPSEPGHAKKVQRGGSFLCTDQYCSRYMVGTRGKGDLDTGTNHLGFRCVMTVNQWRARSNGSPNRSAHAAATAGQ